MEPVEPGCKRSKEQDVETILIPPKETDNQSHLFSCTVAFRLTFCRDLYHCSSVVKTVMEENRNNLYILFFTKV
ncbi:hypothetical protein D3C75_1248300 [compost metagenome]